MNVLIQGAWFQYIKNHQWFFHSIPIRIVKFIDHLRRKPASLNITAHRRYASELSELSSKSRQMDVAFPSFLHSLAPPQLSRHRRRSVKKARRNCVLWGGFRQWGRRWRRERERKLVYTSIWQLSRGPPGGSLLRAPPRTSARIHGRRLCGARHIKSII